MAADVVVTDGANAMTLAVEHWSYDLRRLPKEFTLKTLPSLGVPKSITTDFGSFTEMYSFTGHHATRALAEQLIDYSQTEWFVNRPITVTVPSVFEDDEAIDMTTVSGVEPVITRAGATSDVEVSGVNDIPFLLVMTVVKRLL